MATTINLLDFSGTASEKLHAATDFLRKNPGSTLFIPAGEYIVGDERSREIQSDVMSGKYGPNPQPTMFNPNFNYTTGLDLHGCRDVTVSGYGAVFMVDGFMEPISIKDSVNTHVMGITIDHLRKPFTKATVIDADDAGNCIVKFDALTPSTDKMPALRNYTYNRTNGRLAHRFIPWGEDAVEKIDDTLDIWKAKIGCSRDEIGDDVYITNTYHSRPAILVSHAENTTLTDMTIHSQPGMGIVGFKSRDIMMKRLRVIPSAGYAYSTNTDATHFACCSGTVSVEDSVFCGHGDDAINIHSYYYTITERHGDTCTVQVFTPDGTHAQEPDFPLAGYKLELVDRATLAHVDDYTVVKSSGTEICEITLDHPLPEDGEYLFANRTELPALIFRGNHVSSHLARSVLCKTHHAVIENNLFERCTGTAIHIAAEAHWSEGIASEDVRVVNNVFLDCGFGGHGRTNNASAVSLNIAANDPSGVGIHKNIVIENNTVRCPDAENYAFNIANAEGVSVKGNNCTGGRKVAMISHCRGVSTDIADADMITEDVE